MTEKKKTGFALMSEKKRKAVAVMGGKASQESGKGHKFTSETASMAAKVKRNKNGMD